MGMPVCIQSTVITVCVDPCVSLSVTDIILQVCRDEKPACWGWHYFIRARLKGITIASSLLPQCDMKFLHT